MRNAVGSWAFVIGVVLAVLLGALGIEGTAIPFLLVVLGLVIGFLNVTGREVQPFMMSGAVLVIVSAFGMEVMDVVPVLSRILAAILMLVVPATIVVALKNAFHLARR